MARKSLVSDYESLEDDAEIEREKDRWKKKKEENELAEKRLSQKTTKSKSDLVEKRPSEFNHITQEEAAALPDYLKNQLTLVDGQLSHSGFLQRSHVFRILRIVLSPSEFVLFDYFYDEAWDGDDATGNTRKSLSKISEMTSLKPTTAKTCLRSLEKRGLILVLNKNMRTGVLYKIPQLTKPKNDLVEKRLSQNSTSTKPKNDQPLGRNSATFKELSKELFLKNSLSPFADNFPKQERERFLKWLENMEGQKPENVTLVINDVFSRMKDIYGKEILSPIGYLEAGFLGHLKHIKNKIADQQVEYRIEAEPEPESTPEEKAEAEAIKAEIRAQADKALGAMPR